MKIIRIPDKDTLGIQDGVWMSEPDFMLWTCEETGYECIILRSTFSFSLCGYVGIPETHPLFSLHFNDDVFSEYMRSGKFQAHGGLNFSSEAVFSDHISQNFTKSKWFFGFDCSHLGDFSPAMKANHKKLNIASPFLNELANSGMYRDINYVKKEVISLAKQLKSADLNINKYLERMKISNQD